MIKIDPDLNFHGKKLLVLGGPDVHVAIVRAALELGAYVIVADRQEPDECPAAQVADEFWHVDILDVDELEVRCKQSGVEGVLNFCINPAQKPYLELCSRLGLPCYGTAEQFAIMTDKACFKSFCRRNGVTVLESFSEADIRGGKYDLPLIFKPRDGRASRGQFVIYSEDDLRRFVESLERNSLKDFVIEEYIQGDQDFAFAAIVVDGKVIALKAGDRYTGSLEDGLNRQQICTISPTKQYADFTSKTIPVVETIVKALHYEFGPLFLQGFIRDGLARFYDPDLRFPGSEFVDAFKDVTGFDVMKTMVAFAFTGNTRQCFGDPELISDLARYPLAIFSVAIRPGTVGEIVGYDDIARNDSVLRARMLIESGETIPRSGDIAQRAAEFIVDLNGFENIGGFAEFAYQTLKIVDVKGADMIVSKVHHEDGCCFVA